MPDHPPTAQYSGPFRAQKITPWVPVDCLRESSSNPVQTLWSFRAVFGCASKPAQFSAISSAPRNTLHSPKRCPSIAGMAFPRFHSYGYYYGLYTS
jgi:hypothetical protein